MRKRLKIEGDPYSKAIQLMQKHGYNKDFQIVLGTVVEAPPELKIKLDHLPFYLEKEDLLIAEHLTRHERIVTIEYENPKKWLKDDDIGDEDKDTSSSRKNTGALENEPPYETFNMNYATLRHEDLLLIDDRVIVACDDENMAYIVLDRAVKYT